MGFFVTSVGNAGKFAQNALIRATASLKMANALIIPDEFRRTALAFNAKIKAELAICSAEEAFRMLDEAEIFSQLSRRVRANSAVINTIQYSKLLIIAKIGEILKPLSAKEYGKRGGRGRKKGRKPGLLPFSRPTISLYRKISQHAPEIETYCQQVKEHNTALSKDEPNIEEISIAGFIQFIENIKVAKTKAALNNIANIEAKAVAGVFDVIVVDPPWPQSKVPYPTMTLEEIQAKPLPMAEDCHVFLWTIQPFLHEAFHVLEAWSLTYACMHVWHKSEGRQPVNYPQYNCEFILYARKGSPVFLETKNFPTCFKAPCGEHSAKPEVFYDVLRRVTGGRRLDMYGRRPIKGFKTWGNEANSRPRLGVAQDKVR